MLCIIYGFNANPFTMVMTQFEEIVAKYYFVLKDFPEFIEAQKIYCELYEVRKRLCAIEAERIQYYSDLGSPINIKKDCKDVSSIKKNR